MAADLTTYDAALIEAYCEFWRRRYDMVPRQSARTLAILRWRKTGTLYNHAYEHCVV